MKRIAVILSCLFLQAVFYPAAEGRGQAGVVMKLAIGNPKTENNFGWTPFEILKQEVELRSGGRFRVDLSSQMLGQSSMEMIAMVRDGLVHARDFADGHVATIYPPIQVLSIPYLFANREIAWEVLDGAFGQRLIEDMAEKTGLRPLYWIENGGFRHFSNNKRAIRSPEDMQGLKIRTMEIPLHMKIVSDLGARPVPISWPKVYDAIASGIVDGQENSVGTFMIPHFENIQSHMVLDGHVYGTYTLLMNEAWYQSLPPEMKGILQQAKKVSAAVNRGLAAANEMSGITHLRKSGVEIYKPTPEEIQAFRARTRASALEWLGANVGVDWVQRVLKATAAAEKRLGAHGPDDD